MSTFILLLEEPPTRAEAEKTLPAGAIPNAPAQLVPQGGGEMTVLGMIAGVWVFLFVLSWIMLHVLKISFRLTVATCCLIAVVLGVALPILLVR